MRALSTAQWARVSSKKSATVPFAVRRWYIVLYVFLLLYSPPMFREWGIVSRGVRLDQFLLLVSWFILAVARPNRIFAALTNPIGAALGAFTLASLVSALAAAAFVPGVSLLQGMVVMWGQSRSLLAFLVTFVVIWDAPPDARRQILRAFLVFAAGVAIFAALQSNEIEVVRDFALAHYSRKGSDVSFGLDAGRAFGTFDGQPNILGAFCVLTLGLGLREYSRSRGKYRLLTLAACLLFAWALAVSWSRGAYAGAVVCVAAMLFPLHRRSVIRLGVAALSISALIYVCAPESIKARFHELVTSTESASGESIFATRQVFWRSNLRVFSEHLWFGARGLP